MPADWASRDRRAPLAIKPDYLTDGVHLYEVLKRTPNYGLLGGEFVEAVDCLTDERHDMDPCEVAVCNAIQLEARRVWIAALEAKAHIEEMVRRYGRHSLTSCPPGSRAMCRYGLWGA